MGGTAEAAELRHLHENSDVIEIDHASTFAYLQKRFQIFPSDGGMECSPHSRCDKAMEPRSPQPRRARTNFMEINMSTGKTVIVTGASQGIGAGLVNAFVERGYNVVATSRQVSASNAFAASGRLAVVDGDIGDPDTARRVAETAIGRFGSIDALVNNAGIFFTKPFVDYTMDDFRRLSSTNLEGFIHLTQLVVKRMLAQKSGGSIVSITTPLIDHPIAGVTASVAMMTKGGVDAISKNLAMEYARDGIRVNTVAPGVVDTPLHKDNPKDFLKTLSPMASISDVQEIVDAVVFLTEAPRVTGEVLHVDGGAHLGKW
jgi:NAD(P)-dependent dehydrogenase (short-subunit alcohol dehydrogenase family)